MELILAKNQTEIFSVIYIRKAVFIDEQKVSVDEELDNLDFDANHFLIQFDNEYISTARVYYKDKHATIGRVAVLKPYRNKGIAKFMLKEIIKFINMQDVKKINIGAQTQVVGFYEKLGFKICGSLYLDANIEHYPMELIL